MQWWEADEWKPKPMEFGKGPPEPRLREVIVLPPERERKAGQNDQAPNQRVRILC